MNSLGPIVLAHLVEDSHREALASASIDTIIGYDGEPYIAPGPALRNADVHSPAEKLKILGAIHWLLYFSKPHRHYRQSTVLARFYPCVSHNNFRLYMVGDWPVAFFNWAWVDDATDARLENIDEGIQPWEWASGPNLWMTEIIAPFGHGGDVMWDLQNLFRQGTTAKAVFANDDGEYRFARRYYCSPT